MNNRTLDPNFPMSTEILPEVHNIIAQYARGRRSTGTLTTLNRQIRDNTSCTANCPANHRCYPTDENGCELGVRRPDREHCCQLDISNPLSAFLQTVSHMHRYATEVVMNRNPAFDGFRQDLGRIIPTTIQIVYSTFHQPNEINFNFRFDPNPMHNISDLHRGQIVRLGEKLFDVLQVRFLDDNDLISRLNIYNPRVFVTAHITQRTTTVPRDFLRYARNIKLEVSMYNVAQTQVIDDANLLLTEQHVFDLIEDKLRAQNNGVCNAAIDAAYKEAGLGNFNGIIDACISSSFHGIIVCSLQPDTNVNTGTFHGFVVQTMSPSQLLIAGHGFIPRATKDLLSIGGARLMVIRR